MPSPSRSELPQVPGFLTQVYWLFWKEWRLERASPELSTTAGFFAVLLLVLSSLSLFGGGSESKSVAAGVLWLSLSFAAVLALGRSWAREREDSALLGQLLGPLRGGALFLAKSLWLAAFLGFVFLLLLPLLYLFFNLAPAESLLGLLLIGLLALPAIASVGTLFGAMTARTGARELMLSIVVFPLLAPVLLVAVSASRSVLLGDPLTEVFPHLELLGALDLIFFACGLGLLGALLEDR